jgi:putative flippase GtrA
MKTSRGIMATATHSNKTNGALTSLVSRRTIRQFVFFTAVGGIGTGAHYLTLIGLVEGGLLTAVPASVAGFTVGAIINYVLNYRFTFNSNKSHGEAMSKFFTVAIVGCIINATLMYIGVNIIQVYYLVAQVISTGTVLIWNFITNKLWTFQA